MDDSFEEIGFQPLCFDFSFQLTLQSGSIELVLEYLDGCFGSPVFPASPQASLKANY